MAGIKNFNLTGVSSDLQLGKRGGRVQFDDQTDIFKFLLADGVTAASAEAQDLVVNGNLTVLGDTTTINVNTLTVQDNIIEVNSGETGIGVTKGSAGIDINRGTALNAQILWDETSDTFKFQLSDGTPVVVEGDFAGTEDDSLYRKSDGKVIFDGSGATSVGAEFLHMATETGQITLGARNEARTGDVDLVLTAQGNGTVILTSEGAAAGGSLGSVAGTDLSLKGGDEDGFGEVGDLLLSGGDGTVSAGGDVVLSGGLNGGTVRIDTLTTTVDDSSVDSTISTVGYVKSKVLVVQQAVDAIDTSFIASADTPATYGTAGQYVTVNSTGDGLVFSTLQPPESLLDLGDTPAAYGTPGQVLSVNGTGDGFVFSSPRTLSAIEVSGMTSSVSTLNVTTGEYAVVAEPTAYTDSDGTTQSITLTRITIKVTGAVDAGEGFRVILQDDAGLEQSVIAEATSSDVSAGVYVIDGIMQDVSMTPKQNVAVALVDALDAKIIATAGTVKVLCEYKTNIA